LQKVIASFDSQTFNRFTGFNRWVGLFLQDY
jgi:hypothetical protein